MGNNSKQALLSIVGIAILVIAVVGVSFAFFTYSRNGEANNLITTGTLEFEYEEDSATALALTNQFPQTDVGDNDAFEFDVVGTIPQSAGAVTYTVYAVEGAVPSNAYDANDKMNYSEINIYVTVDSANATVVPAYATLGANDEHVGGTLTSAVTTTQGLQIASGTITANGVEQQHNYTLTMYVNNSVTISDTNPSMKYRASAYDTNGYTEGSASDTRKVYSDMYYSLKVNVEANA